MVDGGSRGEPQCLASGRPEPKRDEIAMRQCAGMSPELGNDQGGSGSNLPPVVTPRMPTASLGTRDMAYTLRLTGTLARTRPSEASSWTFAIPSAATPASSSICIVGRLREAQTTEKSMIVDSCDRQTYPPKTPGTEVGVTAARRKSRLAPKQSPLSPKRKNVSR